MSDSEGFSAGQIFLIVSIPFVNAFVGWITNVVAVYMTFNPVEFIGCFPPYLGWQGIVPRKAEKMASKAVDLMTTKLIRMDEIFVRLDPQKVAEELSPVMYNTLDTIVNEVGMLYAPNTWVLVPEKVKRELVIKVQEESPQVISGLFADIGERIDQVFNLKRMVVDAMVRDRGMMCLMFQQVGKKEFAFIKASGAYFGFLFGLVMMGIYFPFPDELWLLPLAGFLVGYVTNWIALKLIFEPIEPVDLKCYTLHGLFLKRQKEVSAEYAKLVVEQILNAKNILYELVRGPSSDALVEILYKHVKQTCDAHASVYTPLIQVAIGSEGYAKLKELICDRLFEELPDVMSHLEPYADKALDLENTIRERLAALSPAQFEDLLHPIFKEDEIILILVGGVLGLIVGCIQAALQFALEQRT